MSGDDQSGYGLAGQFTMPSGKARHLTPPTPLSTLKGVERGERESYFLLNIESPFFFPLSTPLSVERGLGGEELFVDLNNF